MTTSSRESLSTTLIEGYLCSRGRRYFRGRHDGEFFFVVNAHPRRLHVHLEIPPAQPGVCTIRVAPACFFPAADHAGLDQFADTWNRDHRDVAAIVHGSSDPQRIGVAAEQSQSFGDQVRIDDFATFADNTIAAAIRLFGELTPVVELPSSGQPLLRDAG